jgi:hypothetical protein
LTLLVAAAALVSGCTSVTYTPYVTTLRSPREANAPIDVFPKGTTPPRKFTVIGRITGGGGVTVSGDALLEEMRKKARELGADAVVNYEQHMGEAGTVGAGKTTSQGDVAVWEN